MRCNMKEYLDPIFSAKTTDDVCAALQVAIDSLKSKQYFSIISDYYEKMNSESPKVVQEWCDEMRDDEQAKEEGNLKEIYGLYQGALSRLRELGFRRE